MLNRSLTGDPERIDEFVFRFNRRKSHSKGLLLHRMT